MEPDSKRRIVLPSSLSVRAGMRPLGLMARNQGVFWSPSLMEILTILYLRLIVLVLADLLLVPGCCCNYPSSSSRMDTLTPFGVWVVYNVMSFSAGILIVRLAKVDV